MYILIILFSFKVFALEVIKPDFTKTIQLRIVRADPDSFETYTLMNHNGREMLLVCANNRVYDNNPKAFIEYRNYYNEIAGNFTLDKNEVCLELARFIETSSAGIGQETPFLITLDMRSHQVKKLVYPNVDPYADSGTFKDLLPKEPVFLKDTPSTHHKPVKVQNL